MGSLASELANVAERYASGPRVYADANMPAGLVSFMRQALGWDVFFVMEHDELRRASDVEHYRLSHQMRRVLVTLDRDYFGLATKRGEASINFYDLENRIVDTFPAIPGVASTDKLVVSGLSANPIGLFGVPYHHSNATTGTWLGFDRSTTPEIVANAVNAGGALSLPFARLALNKIGNRIGINNIPNVTAWTHPCQKQAYEEIRPVSIYYPEAA